MGRSKLQRVFVLITAAWVTTAALAGCGRDKPDAATRAEAPTTTSPAEAPDFGFDQGFTPISQWRWSTADPGGYTLEVKLGVGAPAVPEKAPELGAVRNPSDMTPDCARFDEARDGLLPVQLLSRNTSSQFKTDVNTHIALTGSTETLTLVSPRTVYRDASCHDLVPAGLEGQFSVSKEAIDPGAFSTSRAYIVLRGWRSPKYPDGDPTVLEGLGLHLTTKTQAGDATASGLSGPGASVASDGLVVAVPLGG